MAKRSIKKVYIKKHFLDQTGTVLLNTSKGMSTKINGNSLVPTPIVPLVTLDGQNDALENTLGQRVSDQSESLTQVQVDNETAIHDSLDGLADQIEFLANKATPGDEAAITAALVNIGFEVKDPSVRQEQTFEVIETDHGQATLTTEVPQKNKTFIYLWSYTSTPGDPASWSPAVMTITSIVVLTELVSDKRGYFRSAVIPPLGRKPVIDINQSQINWSDPISALIP